MFLFLLLILYPFSVEQAFKVGYFSFEDRKKSNFQLGSEKSNFKGHKKLIGAEG